MECAFSPGIIEVRALFFSPAGVALIYYGGITALCNVVSREVFKRPYGSHLIGMKI